MFASIKMTKNTFGHEEMQGYTMRVYTEGNEVQISFTGLKGYVGTLKGVSLSIPPDVALKLGRALQNASGASREVTIEKIIEEVDDSI